MWFLRGHDQRVRVGLASLIVIAETAFAFYVPRDSYWWTVLGFMAAAAAGVVVFVLRTGTETKTTTPEQQQQLPFIGMFSSGYTDTAERAEELLRSGFPNHKERPAANQ